MTGRYSDAIDQMLREANKVITLLRTTPVEDVRERFARWKAIDRMRPCPEPGMLDSDRQRGEA